MALINRVTRLFRADMHAVLDRIEEPDVLLRQAVREMSEALEADERRIVGLGHERDQLSARQAEIGRAHAGIEEEIDLCFESGKDDLARVLIKRRLETELLQKHLSSRTEAVQKTLASLEAGVRENRARLESMRQKAEILAERPARDEREEAWCGPGQCVREEDVEVAFLREKRLRARS